MHHDLIADRQDLVELPDRGAVDGDGAKLQQILGGLALQTQLADQEHQQGFAANNLRSAENGHGKTRSCGVKSLQFVAFRRHQASRSADQGN